MSRINGRCQPAWGDTVLSGKGRTREIKLNHAYYLTANHTCGRRAMLWTRHHSTNYSSDIIPSSTKCYLCSGILLSCRRRLHDKPATVAYIAYRVSAELVPQSRVNLGIWHCFWFVHPKYHRYAMCCIGISSHLCPSSLAQVQVGTMPRQQSCTDPAALPSTSTSKTERPRLASLMIQIYRNRSGVKCRTHRNLQQGASTPSPSWR